MLEEKIFLSKDNKDVFLTVKLNPNCNGTLPAVLVLPGGEYQYINDEGGQAAAEYYLSNGFHAFILNYSVGDKASFPNPLIDASNAVWEIRKNANNWNVDSNRIILVGLSAGAHLATALATMWFYGECKQDDEMPYGGNKPNAIVTGYTPTTFEDFFNQPKEVLANFKGNGPTNLLDKEGTRFDDIAELTTHNLVTNSTCPAFLWKTTADFPNDTFAYAAALKVHKIPYEVHVFSDDLKCVGMATKEGVSANTKLWPEMSLNWLKRVLDIK